MKQSTCRACGLLLREDARFCDGCGTRLPGLDTAEYKQVTVLFADVVGSMTIAEKVGAERLAELMSELISRSAETISSYDGLLNQFTGDGLMAVFGIPNALEDHAVRACLAALRIRERARMLADDALNRDGVDLQIRIGLNSGRVVAGEIASSAIGYTTFGEHVGLAHRMESAAPTDGILLSSSTARLVEHVAELGPVQLVPIKGRNTLVEVRTLEDLKPGAALHRGVSETLLVGRSTELAQLDSLLDHAVSARGGVARIVGPAGIGKTRIAAELAHMASRRAIPVHTTSCESHTRNLPYSALSRWLRTLFGADSREPGDVRAVLRSRFVHDDPEDLLLLEDLLGVAEPSIDLPQISAEARRRRVRSLIGRGVRADVTSALVVIEDVHWMDDESQSTIAELIDDLRDARSLVVITHRPDYRGRLVGIPAAQSLVLPPLDESQTEALLADVLGSDPSVRRISEQIVEASGGNPFFASEIVHDLVEREVLSGQRGRYRSSHRLTDIAVPPTLYAAIAARIDRLRSPTKAVLYSAAVIGTGFRAELLVAVSQEVVNLAEAIDELLAAELLERPPNTSAAEFAFRHPLIRTVAYESQLKATRRERHRRVAVAIEENSPAHVEQHAGLIASHYRSAGDLRSAYAWQMRAGDWLARHDRSAAWTSWQRAREITEQLPVHDTERVRLQIEVLTRLCAEVWTVGGNLTDARFGRLRQLCDESGDRRSLAVGIGGMIMALTGQHRHREAQALCSELLSLIESLDDPTVTGGLLLTVGHAKSEVGELREALRLAQAVIDLIGGDLTRGSVVFESPLATATRRRGLYRMCLGVPGWRRDADIAVALARSLHASELVNALLYKYILSIPQGARSVDPTSLDETSEALSIAEQIGDEYLLTFARLTRGLVLVYQHDAGETVDYEDGIGLLRQAQATASRRGYAINATALLNPAIARHRDKHGDLDGAIELARRSIAVMEAAGEVLSRGVATTVLVEALLSRGHTGDRSEAEEATTRLAAMPVDDGFVLNTLSALRLRALLADDRGDAEAAVWLREQYRDRAVAADFDVSPSHLW